jgi:non-ribosomal peptide synthetase component F
VQSLPLRVSLEGDPSFLELVRRVRAAALGAEEHGDLPYDRIARAAGDEAASALLQTFFSHMRNAIRAPAFAGTRSAWEFVDPGVARFDLALVVHESPGELEGFLEFDLGIFSRGAGERMARDYARILDAALARPEQRLAELGHVCAPRARSPHALPPRRASGG